MKDYKKLLDDYQKQMPNMEGIEKVLYDGFDEVIRKSGKIAAQGEVLLMINAAITDDITLREAYGRYCVQRAEPSELSVKLSDKDVISYECENGKLLIGHVDKPTVDYEFYLKLVKRVPVDISDDLWEKIRDHVLTVLNEKMHE